MHFKLLLNLAALRCEFLALQMVIQAFFFINDVTVNYCFASGTISISKYPINCVCPFLKSEETNPRLQQEKKSLIHVGSNSVGHSAGFLSLLHIPFGAAGLSGYPDVYCICLKL